MIEVIILRALRILMTLMSCSERWGHKSFKNIPALSLSNNSGFLCLISEKKNPQKNHVDRLLLVHLEPCKTQLMLAGLPLFGWRQQWAANLAFPLVLLAAPSHAMLICLSLTSLKVPNCADSSASERVSFTFTDKWWLPLPPLNPCCHPFSVF